MDELSAGPDRPRRSWPTWVCLVALLGAALFAVTHRHRTPAAPQVPGRSVAATPLAAPHLFVPPRRTTRGRTTVHVTFPEGSTADIGYPASLHLAEMGVRPFVTGRLANESGDCCFRELVVPPQGEAWFARGGPRIRRLDGADGGHVGLYPAPTGGPESPLAGPPPPSRAW
jgi:hypothetical protein